MAKWRWRLVTRTWGHWSEILVVGYGTSVIFSLWEGRTTGFWSSSSYWKSISLLGFKDDDPCDWFVMVLFGSWVNASKLILGRIPGYDISLLRKCSFVFYSISTRQDGLVEEVGKMENENLVRNLMRRRTFFLHELHVVYDLLFVFHYSTLS